jgi:hypothetical protein
LRRQVILEFDEAFWNPELDFFGAAVGGCTPGEDPSAVSLPLPLSS